MDIQEFSLYSHTWPHRLNGIEEYSLGDEMLLYFPNFEKGFSLNNSSKAIWELCNGKHTIIDISQELGQRLGVFDNELLFNDLLSDVIETITQFQNFGLLKLEGVPNGSYS